MRASTDPRENPRLDSRKNLKKKRNPGGRYRILRVWCPYGILMGGGVYGGTKRERKSRAEKRGPFVI